MASTNQGDNAVERLDNAVTAFEQIMTGPEGQTVQVPGNQPQPTLAERVKQNLKPSTDAAAGFAAQAAASAAASSTSAASAASSATLAKTEADRAKTEADRAASAAGGSITTISLPLPDPATLGAGTAVVLTGTFAADVTSVLLTVDYVKGVKSWTGTVISANDPVDADGLPNGVTWIKV